MAQLQDAIFDIPESALDGIFSFFRSLILTAFVCEGNQPIASQKWTRIVSFLQ